MVGENCLVKHKKQSGRLARKLLLTTRINTMWNSSKQSMKLGSDRLSELGKGARPAGDDSPLSS